MLLYVSKTQSLNYCEALVWWHLLKCTELELLFLELERQIQD